MENKKKALIAMSGGVDSSLAAFIMNKEGYDCIGVTMKLYDNEDIGVSREHTCCSLDDIEDARNVAFKIGIPYYVFNFKDRFEETVIRRFISSYENGITPNPCIDCNRFLKFDRLFHRAEELGCDYVVTGHYARIEEKEGKFFLKKALDETKDQSYVLYGMTQYQLQHTRFPLGEMRKTDVRKLAEENEFINASKPDSQDICFVPDGDYAGFLERATGKKYEKGKYISKDSTVLGEHKGIVHYTLGQGKGLGIALGKHVYVTAIDTENNTVTLGDEEDLYDDTLTAYEFNYISGEEPQGDIRCAAKIRYRHREAACTLTPLGEGRVKIKFDSPQRAITPGQAVVLYDGDTVLGGGIIEKK